MINGINSGDHFAQVGQFQQEMSMAMASDDILIGDPDAVQPRSNAMARAIKVWSRRLTTAAPNVSTPQSHSSSYFIKGWFAMP